MSLVTRLMQVPVLVVQWVGLLGDHTDIVGELSRALGSELPLMARDGGFVARGYDAALDETRSLRDESRRLIAGLERAYRESSKMANLRIRHNNVLGFFIEVRSNQGDALALAPGPNCEEKFFHHRQTLASAVRFNTAELADLETRVARAADRALAQELEITQAAEAAEVLDLQQELKLMDSIILVDLALMAAAESAALVVHEEMHTVEIQEAAEAADILVVKVEAQVNTHLLEDTTMLMIKHW